MPYLVGSLVSVNRFQAVARSINDPMTSVDKVCLLTLKDIPPDNIESLAFTLTNIVVSTTQIVELQHTVFLLYVRQYLFPVMVVV